VDNKYSEINQILAELHKETAKLEAKINKIRRSIVHKKKLHLTSAHKNINNNKTSQKITSYKRT